MPDGEGVREREEDEREHGEGEGELGGEPAEEVVVGFLRGGFVGVRGEEEGAEVAAEVYHLLASLFA